MAMLNEIQTDLLNDENRLSSILRKARILANQLESPEFQDWVLRELNGYKEVDHLPDYRQLRTTVSGRFSDGFRLYNNHQVPLFKITDDWLKEQLTDFPVTSGIRSVEDFASGDENQRFMLHANLLGLVNSQVAEGRSGYLSIHYDVSPYQYSQILDTIRNRLLEFIIQFDDNWGEDFDAVPQEEVNQLVQVIIQNSSGGKITMFDQRGQQVNYQFNATGDINFGNVSDLPSLSDQLSNLREEIEIASKHSIFSDDVKDEAKYLVLEASREAVSPGSDKSKVIDLLGKAKLLFQDLAGAAGLVTAFANAIEAVTRVLG